MALLHKHTQRFLLRIVCIVILCFCSNVMAQEINASKEEEQLDKMLEHHNERYMPRALGFSAGYVTPDVFDFSIFTFLDVLPINITDGYSIHVGYEPLHLRVDDFGASDDALFAAGGWFLFNGIDAVARKITGSESDGPGILVLAPLFIWCGMVYIPLVPGSWLGINDQNHFTTHVIQEGFHTHSFIYTNDLSLRFSMKPSRGTTGYFLDTGIRFEKNFAEDFKYRFFVQLGLFGSG
ncbi:hypothetical protein [Fibrobacter sp. UWB5]|uniref:hypothetical protein n=1 Tax=Fibrobacter sp. UWB5 TaxID=1964360 RepID=UPI000B68F23F|nr:hypothetical protein [Fibrobacter sp. UWB5]OWV10586.1 hypothetical protein B7989_11265 [Fibrobacter sp. UWB5]